MYEIDFMAHVGQHNLTSTHPHYQAIYNHLPENVKFNFIEEPKERNPNYNDYLDSISNKSKSLGATDADIDFFTSRIHPNCSKQQKSCLYFVPTHPYFGPEPHVINFEYWLTYYTYLCSELVTSNTDVDTDKLGWNHMAISAMLEPSCKALLIHSHDTINTFKYMTRDYPELHEKFIYFPLASPDAEKLIKPKHIEDTINILFTNSYGGQLPGFNARGGHEAMAAILPLLDKYSNLRLTTIGPSPRFNHDSITQYFEHVDNDTYNDIIQKCHIFLIPSMQLHSISLVKCMCNGIIPIVSDGWGFDEFVTNGHNGFVVEGQNGYTNKKDKNNILQLIANAGASPNMIINITNVLENLINNIDQIPIISNNCIQYAKKNFSINKRNDILLEMIKKSYV